MIALMNLRPLLAALVLTAFILNPVPRAQAEKANLESLPQRRSIVFILTDDQRFDALSALRPDWYRTPHMDRLAAGGAMMSNAFVTTSLCSPSRASILTGLYAHRHGVLDNRTELGIGTPTFPALLQSAGYRTALIGKWHMGGTSDAPRPGFDRWVSFAGQGVYLDPTLNIDGEEVRRKGYISDLLTDEAVDFIETAADEPFLLYLAHKSVHHPFKPAPRHRGAYAEREYPKPATMEPVESADKPQWVREQRNSWHGVDGMYDGQDYETFVRDYAETLLAVDDSVGRVLDALESRGLLDSTLVVLTSDNGFQFGEHGLVDKRTMYETSIRVPMIFHAPAHIEPGQRRGELALNIDLAPTLLDWAGLDVPESMQGHSLLPLIDGRAARGDFDPESFRSDFVYEYFWEADFPQTPTIFGVRTKSHKLIRYHGVWGVDELYDLENDPLERNNLLAPFQLGSRGGALDWIIIRQADPDLRRLFLGLRRRLEEGMAEIGLREEPLWKTAEERANAPSSN